ncbi:hypothetical protein RHS01_07105 [Rhizoctonia solani]|uniref:Uncharacterized protein n=1 Tax=Rhizoctonia solani TaxID=456999 RepID=A0A8H7M3A2_9AGAM|nr:hypothetical protein RHS01_07105 [Rhizoctonia solani]
MSNINSDYPPPPPLSAGMNDPTKMSGSTGSGSSETVTAARSNNNTNNKETEKKKMMTSLWSYILPVPAEPRPGGTHASIHSHPAITIDTASTAATATTPKRNFDQARAGGHPIGRPEIGDRVDRVVDLQRQETKHVHDAIARVGQSVGEENEGDLILGLAAAGIFYSVVVRMLTHIVLLSHAPLSILHGLFLGTMQSNRRFTALDQTTMAHTSKLDEAYLASPGSKPH